MVYSRLQQPFVLPPLISTHILPTRLPAIFFRRGNLDSIPNLHFTYYICTYIIYIIALLPLRQKYHYATYVGYLGWIWFKEEILRLQRCHTSHESMFYWVWWDKFLRSLAYNCTVNWTALIIWPKSLVLLSTVVQWSLQCLFEACAHVHACVYRWRALT